MHLNVLNNFINPQYISTINKSLNNRYEELFVDMENIDLVSFAELIQKESIAARILSYRFTDSNAIFPLIERINEWLSENKKHGKYYFSPLIMTRICKPGFQIYKNNAMLFTEPHYDKIENNYPFFGIWIPLEAVNEETGGLCWFDMPDALRLKYFPLTGKNLSLKDYAQNYNEVDELVKPYLKTFNLIPGDIVIFDESCLHGATKPKSKVRRSLNFQMIHESIVDKLSKFEREKILSINSNLEICNLINLFYLGDIKFVKKYVKNYSTNNISCVKLMNELQIINATDQFTSMPKFEDLKQVIPWSKEYQWLRKYF